MAKDFEDHCWKDIVSPEIIETYQHYRRDVFVGDRPALLAIDLYKLVYKGGPHPPHEITKEHRSTCGIYAYEAIEPTKRLFAAARAAGLPIIYTTGTAQPGRVQSTNRRRPPKREADDFEIWDDFRPEPDDIVIHKERASGFFGTPLIAYLTRLGVGSLIVCGESTSGCVRATSLDGYSLGFHTVVVEECVFDRSPLSHKVNLFDLHHKYADVMAVDDVISHLGELQRASAKSPAEVA